MKVSDRWTHRAFVLGMLFKGIDGLLESGGGVALLLISKSRIDQWADWLAQLEFGSGFLATVAHHVSHAADHFNAGAQQFAIIYLLAHGAVKLALVAGLLRGVRWVFPVALVVLTGFIAYQLYRLTVSMSWMLAALSLIDAIVVALIWLEWRHFERGPT
ncbi:MAG TPA: DUF2127 domain-containing protein [Rhodanobacteraceae bacterium]